MPRYPLDDCLLRGLLQGMENGGKVVEVLVSGVWESLDYEQLIEEDDHLGVNGLHVVHSGTGCSPQRFFCFSLADGRILSSDTIQHVAIERLLDSTPARPQNVGGHQGMLLLKRDSNHAGSGVSSAADSAVKNQQTKGVDSAQRTRDTTTDLNRPR